MLPNLQNLLIQLYLKFWVIRHWKTVTAYYEFLVISAIVILQCEARLLSCSDLRCAGRMRLSTPSPLLPLVLGIRFLDYVRDHLKEISFSRLYLVNK